MGKKAEQIVKMAREMYGTDRITPEQLAYLTDMLKPSTYLLRNHKVRGHPMTFIIKDRNQDKAQAHRPFQIAIANDQHPRKVIQKSRQLGLSELGVGSLIQFADSHSYDSVKCLYTFPTGEQMRRFVQTRLDPVLAKGYYSTIVNPDINSLQAKQIRNSFVYFRSSSKPGSLEGIDVDYVSLN